MTPYCALLQDDLSNKPVSLTVPALSTSASTNSCTTGPALREFFRKSAVLQGKRPGIQGKKWPKYRYCFSCLRVQGGSLPSKFWLSQHDKIGRDPPAFMALSSFMRLQTWGVIPPAQEGHLSDACVTPHENKTKRMRYPPLRCYLEKVLRDRWGICLQNRESSSEKGDRLKKGSFQKSSLSRECRASRESIEPPDCGKKRESDLVPEILQKKCRDFRDSRDNSSEKTPSIRVLIQQWATIAAQTATSVGTHVYATDANGWNSNCRSSMQGKMKPHPPGHS